MKKAIQLLNKKDNQLLAFCMNYPRSVNEIAKHLNIAPSSVVAKMKKLLDAKKIKIERQGKGKKTLVRTKEGDNTSKYMIEALKILKKKKEMSHFDFNQIYSFEKTFDDEEGFNKRRALDYLLFSTPKLVEHIIKITPEGLKFLKQQNKKKHS